MARKDTKGPSECPKLAPIPSLFTDPLKTAVTGIEAIIFESGLPYEMEYYPKDRYFTLSIRDEK